MSTNSIRLTLFDVEKQAEEDEDATKIKSLVTDTVLASGFPARSFLLQPERSASPEETAAIQKDVLRFCRIKDKWTALGSTLAKSQAFHRIHKSENRAIVALPRTEYRKPYIPVSEKKFSGVGKEEDFYPLSISHQFPFVGAALKLDESEESSPRCLVGLDIVAFNDYEKRLYSSLSEFLEVFRQSFTRREFRRIQTNQSNCLEEFYIRWAMKEAYTKALSLGMGMPFDSFEFWISSVDDQGKYISDCVLPAKNGIYFSVLVKFMTSTKPSEQWDFYFLPLNDPKKADHTSGCACVAAGPFPSDMASPRIQVDLEHVDLESLIEWHNISIEP